MAPRVVYNDLAKYVMYAENFVGLLIARIFMRPNFVNVDVTNFSKEFN